jgi:hypothetical protein
VKNHAKLPGNRRDDEDRPRFERDVHHLPSRRDRFLNSGRDMPEQYASLKELCKR